MGIENNKRKNNKKIIRNIFDEYKYTYNTSFACLSHESDVFVKTY